MTDHFLKPGGSGSGTPAQQSKPKGEGGFGEVLKIFLSAFFIAFLIRSFVYEPFSIPSGSMEPTLLVGDTLFVSKFAYGYGPYSVPFIKLPFEGRVLGSQPKRGDIVVFKLPRDTSTDYIKRIVGLPGDIVDMNNGQLFINDQLVEREFKGDVVNFITGIRYARKLYNQELPGGQKFQIYENSDNAPLDNTVPYTVPDGHYFMMGDNRDGSEDSRAFNSVGYVPADHIVGRADRVFYSVKPGEAWWQFWRWGDVMRGERTFASLYREPQ